MLRAILGVCGVGLITFGLFGGQTLENLHRGISGFFTPDTVVVEASSKSEASVIRNEPQNVEVAAAALPANSAEGNESILARATDTGVPGSHQAAVMLSEEDKQALKIETTKIVADKPIVTAQADDAAQAVPAANTIAKASAAAVKVSSDVPVDIPLDGLKEDGVAVVVNATTGVPPSDTLFVLKERVNLREGPSVEHAIVLQLNVGQELMEFKRDGKWVHVGAYGTSGKIGWVHSTLVGQN